MKSGLRILIWAPEVPFSVPPLPAVGWFWPSDDDDYAVVCKRQKQEQAVICRAASHKAPELVFKLSLRNQIINIINIIHIFNIINTTKH